MFEFEFEDGRIITCSGDHKFMCEDKKMRKMSEIFKNGHKILCID
jgi:intein/homing endonuclease